MNMRRHAKPLAGLGYLGLVLLLVLVSIKTFEKEMPWQRAAGITLRTATPGLELNPHSDVKFQGLRVGEVRRIASDGRGARVQLALDEGALRLIPANVDAAIVPKTLFGEKFVDLRTPSRPAAARLVAGAQIGQSSTSVEIGTLFANLVPVLHALQPDQLSVVLNSLATALDGRGATLARSLNDLRAFLGKVNPRLGTVAHDLGQLARTADIYANSAPDLLGLLAASAGISRELLVPQEKNFQAFLDQTITSAGDLETVLRRNSENLIRLTGRSRPVLAVLHEYATNLPCLFKGMHTADILANHATGALGPFLNLTIDVAANTKPYTYPKDLPTSSTSDANNANLPPGVPSWKPHCPEFSAEVKALSNVRPYSQMMQGIAIDPPGAARQAAGTATSETVQDARNALARVLAARALGVPTSQVPGYADLLVAPMLSDGEVSVP